MVNQVKELGAQVNFSKSEDLDLQAYTFNGDILGVYGYQGNYISVDAATRDAFLNGALADLQVQAAGQGMNILYIFNSWNESEGVPGYYHITDLVIGVVAQITRDYNTGPAYLIDALKAIPWFNQMISKMSIPWQAWRLLTPTQTDISYNTFTTTLKSSKYYISGDPVQHPPTDEVKSAAATNVDAALGEFVKKLLDEGYTTTLYGYRLDICFRIENIRPAHEWNTYIADCYTYVRFSADYSTNPDITAEAPRRGGLLPPIVWIAIAAAIIILAAGGYYALQNLTTEKTTNITWGWVQNPETGEWEYVITGQEERTGPPDWWGIVGTLVPVLVISGIGIAVFYGFSKLGIFNR